MNVLGESSNDMAMLFVAAAVVALAVSASVVGAAGPSTVTTALSDDVTLPANLPDPLVMKDGAPVASAEQWREKRRPELLALFAREMYGQAPPRPAGMRFEVFDEDRGALGGKATRRQVAIFLTAQPHGPRMDLLLYLPKEAPRPVPVVYGLNFWGNHAVHADPGIRLTTSYVEQGGANHPYLDLSGVRDHRATDACRGTDAKRWPIEQILARGYGFATAYRGDVGPDISDETPRGVRAAFPQLQDRDDNLGAVAAWAWALSRGMDYLQTDADVDRSRVVLFGWSRLGKAAVWAAANDERFAAVISSEAGAGGATLFHHNVGENVERLNRVFPHWYCRNFRKYVGRETTMPIDQHLVLALIAPRPVYVSASEGSQIFDPVGEFMTVRAAAPVWRFLGATDLPPTDAIPPLGRPVTGRLSYHRRPGRHDVLPFDWEQYLRFCDEQVRGRPGR